jgi:small subunit ribosomal protein S16
LPVKIRLRRMGAKKRPFYRLVVANSTNARDGRFIETIGYYDPCTEPITLKIDAEKAAHWLKCGAQPSDTARALLKKQGIIKATERPVETAKPVTAAAPVAATKPVKAAPVEAAPVEAAPVEAAAPVETTEPVAATETAETEPVETP